MKVVEFYEKSDNIKYDKFDKKVPKFTYYDMLDFAEQYADFKAKEEYMHWKNNVLILNNGAYQEEFLDLSYEEWKELLRLPIKELEI